MQKTGGNLSALEVEASDLVKDVKKRACKDKQKYTNVPMDPNVYRVSLDNRPLDDTKTLADKGVHDNCHLQLELHVPVKLYIL